MTEFLIWIALFTVGYILGFWIGRESKGALQ